MSISDRQQTILVVDDDPSTIQVLGKLLSDAYRIQVAKSAEKALAIIEEPNNPLPDLLLLDIQMPGMDGYEVCRRLKDAPHTSEIPIIFVTARDATSDEERGLNLGAVDYITKPFSPAIVRARVRTHLRLKQKTDLLEQHALLDGLTGTPNRRSFDQHFEAEIKRCQREQHPLSLIMADIDHFKPFNDHYGHCAGDQCLQFVAGTLSAVLQRPGDRVFRYGGEEFIALLPITDAAGAGNVGEKMRAAVEEGHIRHEHSDAADVVTLSLGVTTWLPDGETPFDAAALLKTADEALYAAKDAGRNHVVSR